MKHLVLRLTLLKDSQVINEDVFNTMTILLERLNVQQLINESDTVAMMITHIAMALQRQSIAEHIIEMEEEVKEEINLHPRIFQALILWEENNDLLNSLSENEKYYILANFCNVIGE